METQNRGRVDTRYRNWNSWQSWNWPDFQIIFFSLDFHINFSLRFSYQFYTCDTNVRLFSICFVPQPFSTWRQTFKLVSQQASNSGSAPCQHRQISGLRTSLGHRGWISQYLPRLGGARIQSITSQSRRCSTIRWRRNIKSFGSKFVGIWPWPQAGPLPGLVISYITTRNQWLTPKATCQYLTVAFLTLLISVEN